MTTISTFILKKMINLLSPESHAYDNILDTHISQEERVESESIIKKLKVGDIIFTATPNLLHQVARKFVGVTYDHVSVVINDTQGIHISPPQISRISLSYLTVPSHSPMVLRLNWKQEDVLMFVSVLHSFVGEQYDFMGIVNLLKEQAKSQMSVPASFQLSLSNLKYHQICTNVVMYCLCRANPLLETELRSHPKSYQYYQLGAFLVEDIIKALENTNSAIQVHKVSLPPVETKVGQIAARLHNISFMSENQYISRAFKQVVNLMRKFTTAISKKDAKKYAKVVNGLLLALSLYKSYKLGYIEVLKKTVSLLMFMSSSRNFKESVKKTFFKTIKVGSWSIPLNLPSALLLTVKNPLRKVMRPFAKL